MGADFGVAEVHHDHDGESGLRMSERRCRAGYAEEEVTEVGVSRGRSVDSGQGDAEQAGGLDDEHRRPRSTS